MAVVDADTGKVLATPTIGEGPDAAAFDAKNKLAFSSNGDGTLTVVDAGKSNFPIIQNLTTQRGARTMTFDSASGRVYLPTAQFGPRPALTAEMPHPRPAIVPGSFTVLVVGRANALPVQPNGQRDVVLAGLLLTSRSAATMSAN